ncbi:MAG: GTP-binding protein [Promethearchaeota archaeon]
MEQKYRVLNVLFAGHAQAGKSSLIEVIVGKFPDILDFELSHGTTVSLKVIAFEIKKSKLLLNLLDTAGHSDFKASPALGLEFADLLVLVVSGTEGFQARTFWLFEKAKEKNIPIIIAATKMDVPVADIDKIKKDLEKLNAGMISIIQTSAKKKVGIEDLISKISIYTKQREKKEEDLSFLILGYEYRKGLGNLINVGILSGEIESKMALSPEVKTKAIYSLKKNPLQKASEGEIVQLQLNIDPKFSLGTKYYHGKFISPKIESIMAEILPRKEFFIEVNDPRKFKLSLEILENLKKIIPFDYYTERSIINLLVVGDLQFEFIKERLEDLIEFKIVGSKIKGIITINKISKANYKSASVRVVPRCRKALTVSREKNQITKMYDLLAATTACEAFHLDGLHVDIYSGKNEDDIVQAIAKAVDKVKLIKIVPYQDIIIKIENYSDVFPLIEKYNIDVLLQSYTDTFFLQVKNENFENFFNSLMKISEGKAEIHLFKFEQNDVILAVDPGTRHFGFCLIEKGELPSLWFVNLKNNIENLRSHNVIKRQLEIELKNFLRNEKDIINKIFVGNGAGSSFIIDFLIEYFNIPCDENSCVITDLTTLKPSEDLKPNFKSRFAPPDIFLIDEFKTTKEALFHLQRGELVAEVRSKGFVDHAIAALLIAKRGLKGEIVALEKKPLKQLYDYIVENYAGSYSFSSIHNINDLHDLKPGMYLRVKDSSRLDSNLKDGEIVSFSRFGSNYKNFLGTTLSGNKIVVKFQANVNVRRDFFNILSPVKMRN